MSQDEEHLRLLSIFHYIVGGVAGLFACFPIIHFIVGLGMLVGGLFAEGEGPPAFMGLFFVLFAGAFMIIGWALAGCIIAVGRFLTLRKYYMFCLVMAGIECIFSPFGTVLGVFTIIVLIRPSVKALFMANQPAQVGEPRTPS